MRVFTTLIGLVALSVAFSAAAQSKGKDSDRVDISKMRDGMVVLHDGNGHYVIAMPTSKHYSDLFYGDGKTFYQQRTFGGSFDSSSKSLSARFWSPREGNRGSVTHDGKTWKVECGKRTTKLTQMASGKAAQLIERADFVKPLWKHQAYKLARDDLGNYYYVDRRRDELGGQGFRMWSGPAGNMKRLTMTNIVSDSEGDIFATKSGQLRFITSTNKKESLWIEGKNRRALLNVPIRRNIGLIYDKLGVYLGPLGTPCDDL